MQRAIILTLCLQLAVGARGTSCAAGYTHKATLTGLTCSTLATDAASCSNCCEEDTTTCGGALAKVGAANLACPFDSYYGIDDAWKKTKAFTATPSLAAADLAATKKTWITKCCTKRATCGAAPTCAAGMSPKSGMNVVMCAADAASCADSCCEVKVTSCGGYYAKNKATAADVACATPADQYLGSDDTWKSKVITGAAVANPVAVLKPLFQASCCAAKATCASTGYSCPAGKIRDDNNKATTCTGDASTCAAVAACCKDNGCGAFEANGDIACTAAGSYYPGKTGILDTYWKNKKTTDATTAKTDCCTPKATCKHGVCPAGGKKKTGADLLSCPSNAASCAWSASCCEKDTTTCGGLVGISCAYGFFDESTTFVTGSADKKKDTPQSIIDAWRNKPATEANKGIDCCTAKAVCKKPVLVGTTTPAPAAATTTPAPAAATTTPATAIRRYSEHVQEDSDRPWGANMVWLGVGGLIGMSVLSVVQGLRSRMPVASARYMDVTQPDDGEVNENLLHSASLA